MRCDFETDSLEEIFYYSLLFTEGNFDGEVPNLFHYTAVENREKIIKNDGLSLRFTRADKFQDKKEGKHIIPILCDLLEDCQSHGLIDEEFYRNASCIIENSNDVSDELRNLYVFCFSKNGTSAFLKENYACKGNTTNGIVIGIKALSLEDLLYEETKEEKKWYSGTTAPIFIKDVLYNQEDLKECIRRLLLKTYELRKQDDAQHKLLKKIIRGLLYSYGLVYKDKNYRNEEETRIIVDASEINFCVDVFSKCQNDNIDPRYIYLNLPRSALYGVEEVNLPCPTSPAS